MVENFVKISGGLCHNRTIKVHIWNSIGCMFLVQETYQNNEPKVRIQSIQVGPIVFVQNKDTWY